MKKILLPILGTAAFIIAVGLLVKSTGGMNGEGLLSSQVSSSQKQVVVSGKTINVDVANTEAKRSLGLAKRSSLGTDSGMLFVFDKKQAVVNFWMKDMEIPLDIIWISEGKIVKIDKEVPAQKGVGDNMLTIYPSGRPIDYVLEVNSGYTTKNNIKVGDTIDLSKAL